MKPEFGELANLAWSQFWQVTVVALVVGVLVWLFCRRRPHLAYMLWLLVIIKCLTPPILSSPTGIFSWAQVRVTTPPPRAAAEPAPALTPPANVAVIDEARPWSDPTMAPVPTEAVGEIKTAAEFKPPRQRMRTSTVLGIMWLCGSLVYAGMVIGLRVRWSLLLRNSSVAADGVLASLLADLSKRLGVRRKVRLLVTSKPLGPVAYGVWRPTVLLPELLLTEKPPQEIEAVLAHELIHLRRGDPAVGVVQLLTQLIWWFHPLVWWANRQTCRERERCCDEEVVARLGCEPGQYAQGLLDVLKLRQKLRPAFAFPGVRPGEITSKRMEEIMEPARRFHRRTPRWCWLIILAAAILILPGRGLIIGRAAEPPKPDEPVGRSAEPPKPDEKEVGSATTKPSPVMTLRRVGEYLSDWARISSDGKYLCRVTWEGLIVLELGTGEKRVLAPSGSVNGLDLAVSPDGKTVACRSYDSEKNTYAFQVVALDGSGRRVLCPGENIAPKDWSSDGKRILGIRRRTKNRPQLVCVSTEDGSVQVVKTFAMYGPKWGPANVDLSPDGRYVAYNVVQQEGSWRPEGDILTIAVDRDQETPVVEHPADDKLLGWTPDGKYLLFASDRSGTWDAWLLRVADGKPQGWPQMAHQNIGAIDPIGFTQNGAYYYGVRHFTGSVYTATLDLKTGKVLSSPKPVQHGLYGCPAWSPDGQYLAYCTHRRRERALASTIRIRSLATGEERVLDPGLPKIKFLTWYPDGQYLLASHLTVRRDTKGWTQSVYQIDVETGESNLLFKREGGSVWRAELSPDRKSLVYSAIVQGDERVLARDLETGREKKVCEFLQRGGLLYSFWDLAPDGKRLAVADGGRSSGWQLKIISVEGAEVKELLPENWDWIYHVAWAPDGQSVLFAVQKDFWHWELWQVSAEGGQPRKLFTTPKLGSWRPALCVHPDGRRIAFVAYDCQAELWVMENFLPAVDAAAEPE